MLFVDDATLIDEIRKGTIGQKRKVGNSLEIEWLIISRKILMYAISL